MSSTYHLFFPSSNYLNLSSSIGILSPSHIWGNWALSKVIVFLWQLIPDRFPSRDDLFNRKVIIDHVLNACHICGDLIDSISHLFVICDLVRSV